MRVDTADYVQGVGAADNECRHDSHVHQWFELTHSSYLVLPRSLMQAMPVEWQKRMTDCLEEMCEVCAPLKLDDNYTVHLRDKHGRFVRDPYSNYRRPLVDKLG